MTDHERPESTPAAPARDEAPTERLDRAPTERLDPASTEWVDAAPTERVQPAPTERIDRTPEPPRGPHAPTILLALICLAVAGLAIGRQVTGFSGLSWSGSGPAIIVGAGVVLLAVGVLGLVRDRRSPQQR